MQKTYYEKLKDPRWQKKRLEVMERDDFSCDHCCDSESTLNVHHAFYIKNRNPWDYSIKMLTTLCSGCHKRLTNNLNKLHYLIHRAGEFAPFDFFNDLIILFVPFKTNKEKFKSLCNIIINMYFHDPSKKYEKIFYSFMEKINKEVIRE